MPWTLSLLPALILGCTSPDPEPTPKDHADEAMGGCDEISSPLTADEVTALGFAADEVLPMLEGAREADFVWARDGSATGLALALTPTGTYRYVESEPTQSAGGGPEPALAVEYCVDRVEIEAVLTFVTEDGSFDESLDIALSAEDAGYVSAFVRLDPASLSGTYDLDEDIALLEPDLDGIAEKTLFVDLRWSADHMEFSVTAQITGEEECAGHSGDCAVWASRLDVGHTPLE